jgi:hypothetical protein
VNGATPDALSVENEQYHSAQFFLVPQTGTIYRNPSVSVIRKRLVGDGFHEEVAVLNHSNESETVEVRVESGSDFADLFEINYALVEKGEHYRRIGEGELVLGYRHGDLVRETRISSSGDPTEVTPDGFVLLGLEPAGHELASDAVLPASVGRLTLRGIPGRWMREHATVDGSAEIGR